MYARLFLILLALFSLDAKAQTIQESVAFAIIGEPKYAAGFSHFDYVNPRAPKGGTLTLAAIGTFDNFNRYALRGNPAVRTEALYDTLFTTSDDEPAEITTVPYDSYQNAKLDLQNGRIDAVFGDTAVVTEWLKSNPKLAAVGDKVTDKAYFGTGLGIAVRQGNTDLQQKFNAALEKVKKDGTYQTIYNKWFQK